MRIKTSCYGFIILVLAMLLTGCMVNIGVTVTGLTSTGLVLQNNSSDDLIVNADGNFTFSTQIASGGTYAVTVKTQPSGQLCAVGNGSGTASLNGNTINVQCATNVLQLLAGGLGGNGNADGTGVTARFNGPSGIAVDSMGNAYVADSSNNTIRKISPAGVVTTLAGTAGVQGSADGIGAAASFNQPLGIAVDNIGNVYVAESSSLFYTGNNTIRKITPTGVVTTLAGMAGSVGSADGTGANARFNCPANIAVDGAGNVYVADTGNNTIRKISPEGEVTTLAGAAGIQGNADGVGAAARFYWPSGIAVDSTGNVFVADRFNNTIRKINPAGAVTTLVGSFQGSADGTGTAARFYGPAGIALDSAGNAYVTDIGNNTIRRIDPAGVVTTLAGTAGMNGDSVDGTGAAAKFISPYGIALDGMGNVYVTEYSNNTIRKIDPARVVTTLAGEGIHSGSADGTGATARFGSQLPDLYNNISPRGIAIDSSGNTYVADTQNDTIRKISPMGVVTTLAGTVGSGGSADGIGAAARFDWPSGIAVDSTGNVYVADSHNATIRKISPAGVVTTLAGWANNYGSSDGIGAGASFGQPVGIAVDSMDNIYVADGSNANIRKISPWGVVTTVAGTAGVHGSADGAGTAATFTNPWGIAVDGDGNIYVADYFADFTNVIRKINPSGIVSTLAETKGVLGSFMQSYPPSIFSASSIAADRTGNIYVAGLDHTVKKVSPTGVVSTVLGIAGKSGVQLDTLPASLGNGQASLAVSDYKLFVISESSVLWAPKP